MHAGLNLNFNFFQNRLIFAKVTACFRKSNMAAAAIFEFFSIYLRFPDFQMQHSLLHLLAKYDVNRTINNQMVACYVKFKMAVAAILDFWLYLIYKMGVTFPI